MTIIAENVPPAIRGILKRWFLEPRPNVFVGTINSRTREKTLEYIKQHAKEMSMLIISSDRNCQGFSIEEYGTSSRKRVSMSGLCLIGSGYAN